MNADQTDFLYSEETHAIIGCSFEVLNEIGHGLHEKIYENALVVEFGLRDISFSQQPEYGVNYKSIEVGKFIPDLITHEKIVVDTKTIEKITEHERGQMLNYLRITGLKVGLIINFKHAKLEWLRIARQ
ncbi:MULTISPECIES: GxxExxY protein [unclassified Lentimonas]|uniref:GxxExxY protein n=1 Tax=unclassified Lentimonas TaxID=2630993 RepID=UPI001321E092|nr:MULTISPECIES: GxxExxY protein [unclassified Lentimonas]CAA6692829.1 conserved hypothetical protein [Lentimonas sp. CC19]CAA6695017.1 conserved hypothetical protein [Lentimonas sp. CC10]CAA7069630.1 conserved hypothetical protein [Lentimonas sp. CC11]